MIYIKNVLTLDHEMIDFTVESPFEEVISATGLTLFPALVDPHICIDDKHSHLGWKFLSRSALSGGTTTFLACPKQNNGSHQEIKQRLHAIDKQLKKSKIPLDIFSLASPKLNHLDILPLSKPLVKGIYLSEESPFFNPSEEGKLDRLFRLASEHNLPISFNITKQTLSKELNRSLTLVQKYNTKIYLYPIYKPKLLDLIAQLKSHSFPVYCGTHLLFLFAHRLNRQYKCPHLEAILSQCTPSDTENLWMSIQSGNCDCVGSNYNLSEVKGEKAHPIFNLKGMGTMELLYPLLLTAHKEGLISIEKFLQITRGNALKIFNLNPSNDIVLVNMNTPMKASSHLFRTIGNYQAFLNLQLYGWPIYTISQGRSFKLFTKK